MCVANNFFGGRKFWGWGSRILGCKVYCGSRDLPEILCGNIEPSLQIAADIEIVFSCFLFKIN